ncbi:MAG: hypothetical protein Edafosvirus2_33 [Edafosvirus sp.]|uniref:Uncharacterized protein n=1 Tax=Edafosvirus sp. TaxID=2487765 RepID=A0A3G4ZU62_9VIRU|nr:MAG: hypothetical protein Edafosvirus2_33 [Edafosvirus sp.]
MSHENKQTDEQTGIKPPSRLRSLAPKTQLRIVKIDYEGHCERKSSSPHSRKDDDDELDLVQIRNKMVLCKWV